MVENNHLLNHRMEKKFVSVHFSEPVMEYYPKHHQIFVILLKMVEELLLHQVFSEIKIIKTIC